MSQCIEPTGYLFPAASECHLDQHLGSLHQRRSCTRSFCRSCRRGLRRCFSRGHSTLHGHRLAKDPKEWHATNHSEGSLAECQRSCCVPVLWAACCCALYVLAKLEEQMPDLEPYLHICGELLSPCLSTQCSCLRSLKSVVCRNI